MKQRHDNIKAKKEQIAVDVTKVEVIRAESKRMRKGPIQFKDSKCKLCENRPTIFFPCRHVYCNRHELPVSENRGKICLKCYEAVDFDKIKRKFDGKR